MSQRGSFLLWDYSKRKRQSQDCTRRSILCTRPPVRAEGNKVIKAEECSHMLLLMKDKNGPRNSKQVIFISSRRKGIKT